MAERTIPYDQADCCLTGEDEATTEEIGRRFAPIENTGGEEKKSAKQKIAANSKEDILKTPQTNAESPANAEAKETAEETAKEGREAAQDAPAFSAEIRKRNKFFFGCYLCIKRLFDIVFSAVILVAFSWLYLILALAVKCSDGGKVIYKHARVGKNGKDIYIAKFRSMKRDADKLDETLTDEQRKQYEKEFKIDDDPRITKIGRFLRTTSLDELPQIWDIFIGKLSFVGPRPLMRDELESKYGAAAEKFTSVKPGLMGWWTAHGRSNCTYESGKRQTLELYYVDHCSIWLDIRTIFITFFAVLRRDGAK